MNKKLKEAFDKTVSCFMDDPRVVAAYHSGSIGTHREDEFSDVDPVFLIKTEEFITFDRELPQLFEKIVAKPILWWPERWIWVPGYGENVHNTRNYAIFFEFDDELLQYDINIGAAPINTRIKVGKNQFIFDKVNVLEITSEDIISVPEEKKLVWIILMYWIYVYIHVKYIKRQDIFKLLYAQQELFSEHLEVLRYIQPEIAQQWWPLMVKQVDESRRKNLLTYFGQTNVDSIVKALQDEIISFSNDARQACAKWQAVYPEAFEFSVINHLKKNGIIC